MGFGASNIGANIGRGVLHTPSLGLGQTRPPWDLGKRALRDWANTFDGGFIMGNYDPERHHRRSIRLKGYNYAQGGAYFLTLCTWNREHLFGQIIEGQTQLNEYGLLLETEWLNTPKMRIGVELDAYVIMPNHFHAILVMPEVTINPQTNQKSPSALGRLVGGFKAAVTKQVNLKRGAEGVPVWQRNYHEHIIRNEKDLERIREYIFNNPSNWPDDPENV